MFFWTNIEISLSVVSACLPTYRPIWLYFKGKPLSTSHHPKRSFYSRFGLSFIGNDKRSSDCPSDTDKHNLTGDQSVDTVVETGDVERRGDLDDNTIAVELDMYVNSKARQAE